MGHALIENRHGLVVQADVTTATGRAERAAALAMIDRHEKTSEHPLTLAADKANVYRERQALTQGLRHLRFCCRSQAEMRDAACCAKGQGVGH